jgi:hypothetical protein
MPLGLFSQVSVSQDHIDLAVSHHSRERYQVKPNLLLALLTCFLTARGNKEADSKNVLSMGAGVYVQLSPPGVKVR